MKSTTTGLCILCRILGIYSGDNEHYRAKIVTKRNDSRLNNHQQLQLQRWRANCDIQVVIDHYACVEYLTKYAAEGEPRSPILTLDLMDLSPYNYNFDLDKSRQKFHHRLKEHHKISNIPKFRCEML